MTIHLNSNAIQMNQDAPGKPSGEPGLKEVKAAKDFEAMLLGQMLSSMREEGSSWLGTGDDQASDSAFGLGEQELAKAITAGGGLGLSKLVAAGLAARGEKVTR
jgi:flagellar protein FlgJ